MPNLRDDARNDVHHELAVRARTAAPPRPAVFGIVDTDKDTEVPCAVCGNALPFTRFVVKDNKLVDNAAMPASPARTVGARASCVYRVKEQQARDATATPAASRRGFVTEQKGKITREEISASPPRSESRRRTRRPSRP